MFVNGAYHSILMGYLFKKTLFAATCISYSYELVFAAKHSSNSLNISNRATLCFSIEK